MFQYCLWPNLAWKESLLADLIFSSSPVPAGGFLLCVLLRFSPALPRIPDYRVRYELWMEMTYRESIRPPRVRDISSVFRLLKCYKGGNMLNLTMKDFSQFVRVPFYHTRFCLFQLFHHLHHVPRLLSGAGQRCEVRGCHAVPRVV